jgi:glycerol uptake facilitator-like aquaporin
MRCAWSISYGDFYASSFVSQADYLTNVSCFFDEFLGTAILLICVLSFTDRSNGPPPDGLVPLALFILVLGIGSALGIQTGYAINPARDLGPRLLTAMVGYGGQVFSFRKCVYFPLHTIILPFPNGFLVNTGSGVLSWDLS